MIDSVLVANRGEIARRIIRTARRLGVRTIAVYSDADKTAPHVREADEAVRLGPAPARESYLNAEALLAAAAMADAAAVHPGYGFLSENAEFAQAVVDAGRIWVGPPPQAIRAMGRKDAAKRLMAEAGVPTTPGYLGDDQADEALAREAARIGWPVLLKAVAGGGGKGMRRVQGAGEFEAALASARREAFAGFGDDRMLIERYVSSPRHIEVQIFADSFGEVVHLFERDCSLQRRHQKIVEESPAPGLSEDAREAIFAAAIRAAKAVSYVNAGTVEFIADGSDGLRPDRIWFMEMNTRLQVEHPVTEAITGLDLVEWQLRVASGEPLPRRQDEIRRHGAAIEARLYAEDPAVGFLPSAGVLERFTIPDRVRTDCGVEEGGRITPDYDPMIAKLVAHGENRAEAVMRLAEACEAVEVWPVRTNAGFLARLLRRPEVQAGGVDTGFVELHLADLTARPRPPRAAAEAAAAALAGAGGRTPWRSLAGFRMGAPAAPAGLVIEDEAVDVALGREPGNALRLDDSSAVAFVAGEAFLFIRPGAGAAVERGAGDGRVRAPMPGRIVSVWVRPGDEVVRGQQLVALEAMKMEHALAAPFDARVAEAPAREGAQVSEGDLLVALERIG